MRTIHLLKKRPFFLFMSVFFLAANTVSAQNIGESNTIASIAGIWENKERFIEFSLLDDAEKTGIYTENNRIFLNMRTVLKPYYTFAYTEEGNCTVWVEDAEESNQHSLFYLHIKYPLVKKTAIVPVCIQNNKLFTSFYERIQFKSSNEQPDSVVDVRTGTLYGFWIEQGTRNGILLYPEEPLTSIDAYFFTDKDYIRFRYWLDDLAYTEKPAYVKGSDGVSYEFPKLLKRGDSVYSCITNNGSILRNFETGTYTISSPDEAENAPFVLTLNKQGAGTGSHAAADTYPHEKFAVMENLPLYVLNDNRIFAFGEPYLTRSKAENLDRTVKEHNAKKRKSASD
ncbi:hypothetical protein [Treponema pedis]|uniref:hypothetical protein n=1 Tax=Treponema pedis TaxID=409322 RepID=UPI0031418211